MIRRLISLTIVLSFSFSAHPQILTGVVGSVLIGKAGRELRETVDRAKEAGQALIERANEMGRQRLNQIDEIVNRTGTALIGQAEDATLKLLTQAKKDIDAVRESTIADLKGVIWEAECAGKKLLLEDSKDALGGLGRILNTHQIELSPPIKSSNVYPWYCTSLWCSDPYVVKIVDPFGDTYISVREVMERSIRAEIVKETTPAHRIVGTYEYLSAFALKTSCFYPGSSDVWNREYLKYREEARSWRKAVRIKIQ